MSRYAPARDVAWIDLDGAVYLAAAPDPPIVVLEGPAALIWRAALSSGREGVASEVARTAGVSIDDVRSSVMAFVDDMVARGFLIEL